MRSTFIVEFKSHKGVRLTPEYTEKFKKQLLDALSVFNKDITKNLKKLFKKYSLETEITYISEV